MTHKTWRKRRKSVAQRDGFRCFWCRQPVAFKRGTVDHIVCKARGGSDSADNLVWSCQPCNQDRGHLPAEFYAEKKLRQLAQAHQLHQSQRQGGTP